MMLRKKGLIVAVAGILAVSLVAVWLVQPQPLLISGDLGVFNPLAGATISIYTLDGDKIIEGKEASSSSGSFMISVESSILNPFPSEFRIVTSGGELYGDPFEDNLTRIVQGFDESKLYHVNEITTLIAAFMDQHPDVEYFEAEETVKTFLGVPSDYDLVKYAEFDTVVYSPSDFYFQSYAPGGLTNLINQLLNEMDSGVEQHVFSTENLYALPRPNGGASIATNLAFKSVAEGLLHGAIEGAGMMIGEEVMGFVLHDLFGIKDATESALDEIKESLHEQSKMLKEIQSQINDLKNEVKFYADQIQVELEQLEFTLLSKPADIAAKNIEVRHNLLTGYSNTNITELKQSEVKYNDFTHEMNKLIDEITSTDAGVWNDLNVIEENLKSSPGTTGMLELWSKAVYTGKEKNVKKAELPSLTPEIYDTLWSFYNKYLTAQLQGYTLLVEAYNARSDFTGAQIAMEEMNSTITEQVLQLRPLIEQHLLRLNDPIDLQRKEFPVMEIGVWYEFIGWENVPSLFHTLDQDITWILGSMKYPPRYNSFTARVLLYPKINEYKLHKQQLAMMILRMV